MNFTKHILSTLIAFSCISVAFSQEPTTSKNVSVTHSSGYPVIDAYSKKYFKTEDGILSIKTVGRKNNEFIFQKFTGNNLNETSRVTELLDGPQFNVLTFNPFGFYEIGETIQFLYILKEKGSDKQEFFALEVNLSKGGFIGEPKSLFTVTKKLSTYYSFSIDFSENKEKIIFRYNYAPEIKKDSESKAKIGMAVFNSELEKLWDNDIIMPQTENLLSVVDFTIDSYSNGYFLLRKSEEEISRKTAQDPDNFSLSILKVDENGASEETSFKIQDKIIDNVLIKENKNGDIVCAGYYRKPKSYSIDGVFTAILSQDGSLTEPSMYEFSMDFIKQYRSISEKGERKLQEKEDKGELGMSHLQMRSIIDLSDGSTLITGEIFYITTTTDSKGNTRTTYHYNDIILTKINVDGEVEWMKKIPKKSTRDSYRQFISDDFIYITFSDNPLNAALADDKTPEYARPIACIAYKIELEEATHEYLTLFSLKTIDEIPVYQFNLDRIVPISDNEFAVEMYIKKKQDMMFKIEFEEE